MGRPPCCDKSNVKRGLWTADEDAKMLAHVSKYGIGNWTSVPKKAGLNRCGKSCRLRWTNYLRPDLKHDNFTPQEEELIINLHQAIGSRWSLIAKRLPGRTDNDVKNYWNTKLKKKLSKMGIDHVTHKPFSQILSDYGNINGLPNSGHNIATFDRNLDNIFLTKPEPSSCITGFPATNMITINPSLDFLSHFQVISQENNMIPLHFFNEVTSSCSSSSSSHVNDLSTAQTLNPSSSSSLVNWTEFLINQEQDLLDLKANGMGDEVRNYSPSCEFGSAINGAQRSCNNKLDENPSVNSFVDSILDQDSQLREAFPEFLYESFEDF